MVSGRARRLSGDGLPAEFVEVEGDGGGAVEAGEGGFEGVAEEEWSAVGGVDMEGVWWVSQRSAICGRGSMLPVSVVLSGGDDEGGGVAWRRVRAVWRSAGSRVPVGGWGWRGGAGRPRSQAERWMLWWALAPQMIWRGVWVVVRAASRARRRASWLDSVPPVVTRASAVGWSG
ncbi:hypothetical protein GCM10020000_61150 [Streptomyces olivoverticillatus]